MDKKTLLYWLTSLSFCSALGASSIAYLLRIEIAAESLKALGYPVYFMTILGLAKLLGVIALLVPGRPLLKEWAYAGFTFNLMGAVSTHLFVGDPASRFLTPVVLLFIGAASYLLRPAARRLPSAPTWAEPGFVDDSARAAG